MTIRLGTSPIKTISLPIGNTLGITVSVTSVLVRPPRRLPLSTTFAKAGRVCLAGFAALRALQRGSAFAAAPA